MSGTLSPETILRDLSRLWVSLGRQPVFFTASIYFAEVPKMVIFC